MHVFNGKKGWTKRLDGIHELPKDYVALRKNTLYAIRLVQMLARLKDKAVTLSALGEIKIDGRPAVGLKATRQGLADADIFFDKKTALPVKCQLPIKELGGQEVIYDFFFTRPKKMGGINHFTKITIHRDGKKALEIEITELKARGKLEAELFARPK